MGLKKYGEKRDFRKTPEPPPGRPRKAGSGFVYVVQKHQASRLHYDLRLEQQGVLRSWAVPKMPLNSPGTKRLAVETEDHPLEYAGFEGAIPEPEYGAGTVEIWDRGEYVPLEITPAKWIFEIKGSRLAGRFALVKIKDIRGGDKSWLFFKLKAGAPSDASRLGTAGRRREGIPGNPRMKDS